MPAATVLVGVADERHGQTIDTLALQAHKATQFGLTRHLAHELGPFSITVNNVTPGFVRSSPATERQWQSYGPERRAALTERIPVRRLGTPGDIADAVFFLASDHAGWITGEVLSVSCRGYPADSHAHRAIRRPGRT